MPNPRGYPDSRAPRLPNFPSLARITKSKSTPIEWKENANNVISQKANSRDPICHISESWEGAERVSPSTPRPEALTSDTGLPWGLPAPARPASSTSCQLHPKWAAKQLTLCPSDGCRWRSHRNFTVKFARILLKSVYKLCLPSLIIKSKASVAYHVEDEFWKTLQLQCTLLTL